MKQLDAFSKILCTFFDLSILNLQYALQLLWELDEEVFEATVTAVNARPRTRFHTSVFYECDKTEEWGYFMKGHFHTKTGDHRPVLGVVDGDGDGEVRAPGMCRSPQLLCVALFSPDGCRISLFSLR